jgi:hypothetical protein
MHHQRCIAKKSLRRLTTTTAPYHTTTQSVASQHFLAPAAVAHSLGEHEQQQLLDQALLFAICLCKQLEKISARCAFHRLLADVFTIPIRITSSRRHILISNYAEVVQAVLLPCLAPHHLSAACVGDQTGSTARRNSTCTQICGRANSRRIQCLRPCFTRLVKQTHQRTHSHKVCSSKHGCGSDTGTSPKPV